jgi:hypothetical protein
MDEYNSSDIVNYVQLIYSSSATQPFSSDDLRNLLLTARKNNHSQNITGMLLYHEGFFLQVLEGEEKAVKKLFNHIDKDPRHNNVRLIIRNVIDRKEFGDWSMGFVDTSGIKEEGFADYYTELEKISTSKTKAKKILKSFQEGLWRINIADK